MSFYKIIDSNDQKQTIFDFAQKLYNSVDLDNTDTERYSIEKSIVMADNPDLIDCAHATLNFNITDWDDPDNHDGIVIDIMTSKAKDHELEAEEENRKYVLKLEEIIENEYLPTITDEDEKLRIKNILLYNKDDKLLRDGDLAY